MRELDSEVVAEVVAQAVSAGPGPSLDSSTNVAARRVLPQPRARVHRVLSGGSLHGSVGGVTQPAQLSFDFTRW